LEDTIRRSASFFHFASPVLIRGGQARVGNCVSDACEKSDEFTWDCRGIVGVLASAKKVVVCASPSPDGSRGRASRVRVRVRAGPLHLNDLLTLSQGGAIDSRLTHGDVFSRATSDGLRGRPRSVEERSHLASKDLVLRAKRESAQCGFETAQPPQDMRKHEEEVSSHDFEAARSQQSRRFQY